MRPQNIRYTEPQIHEEFVWGDTIYGIFWKLDLTTGAGTNTTGGEGEGCCAILSTGTNANDYECTATRGLLLCRKINPRVIVKLKPMTDLIEKEMYFGFSDDPMGLKTDYCYFEFDYSVDAVNWWMRSGDGVDASCGVGPTAAEYDELELSLAGNGDATFKVNGVVVGTVTGAVGADTPMYLFFGIETETAKEEVMHCEFMEGYWDW